MFKFILWIAVKEQYSVKESNIYHLLQELPIILGLFGK
jgi:hypothetical protein